MDLNLSQTFQTLWQSTSIVAGGAAQWKDWVMVLVGLILLYLGIFKKIEPLLIIPIGFGAVLSNLPVAGGYFLSLDYAQAVGGIHEIVSPKVPLLGDILYFGVKNEIYPILIFIGIGAMTDFAPLIAQPSSFLLGAAAQFGVYAALLIAVALGFNLKEAASIGIIGGADGPTAIYLAVKLAPHLLGPIAVAAYTYMSLVPVIQPPIMRWMVTEKEAKVHMHELRPVSKVERILFPIIVTVITSVFIPAATPLIGAIMFGNLIREVPETKRLSDTAANELINIVTIFQALAVGASMKAATFLTVRTLMIVVLGVLAFAFATFGGLVLGKIMHRITGGRVNPLIGSAGVSAVPMSARVSQTVAQSYDPHNFILMHAMGPNVAGVIGTAVAAGFFIAVLGH
ncbi:sodium ion-translocating decarboxylase subunit beta [Coprothermobacteraceae bacterium]|nr:sodium ion-translocating decarboxylase subunit beta [Coprothermobacteraceae bacterium]